MTTPEGVTNDPSEERCPRFSTPAWVLRPKRGLLRMTSKERDRNATEAAAAAPVVRNRSRGRTFCIAVITVAAVAAIVFHEPIRQLLSSPSGLELLIQASAGAAYRPFDGRLSGGFPYKPVRPKMRDDDGARGLPDGDFWKIAAAALRLQEQQRPADAHAQATVHLLLGNYEKAVSALEELIRERSSAGATDAAVSIRRADLLNDLSAAYYARGQQRNYPSDFFAALDAAEQAWMLKQTPEIAWNRAVAASGLRLDSIADRAWNDFLGLADSPEWRRESADRRAALHRRSEADEWSDVQLLLDAWHDARRRAAFDEMVTRLPARATQYFDEVLLPAWASAQLAGRDQDRSLEIASQIARHPVLETEPFLSTAISAIEHACVSARRCDAAARAHLAYAEGERLFRAHQFTQAAPFFAQAEPIFAQMASPYTHAARIRHAGVQLAGNDFRAALRSGREILADAQVARYRMVRARVHWLIGLGELHAGHPEESLEHYRAAHRLFLEARDTANVAAIEVLLAEALEFAGDPDRGNEHHVRSLELMAESGDRSRYGLTLYMAGHAAVMRTRLHAARLLLDEAIRVSASDGRVAIAALAAQWQAAIALRNGDVRSGSRYAKMGMEYSRAVSDAPLRARIAAYAYGGTWAEDGVAATPEAALNDAIRFFTDSGDRSWLPQLLQQRASLHRTRGDAVSAERDLREGIQVAEDVVRATPSAMREAFTANVDQAYSDLIDLLQDAGRSAEALEISERERLLGRRSLRYPTVHEAIARIPADVCVAVFSRRARSVIVWVASGGRLRTVEWEISPTEAADHLRRVQEPYSSAGALSSLYNLLMRPWLPSDVQELVIVPAAGMENVPFSALLDRHTQESLIDRVSVSLAVSVTAFAESLDDRRDPSARLLIVGDPTYRKAPRLPATRAEARAVSRHYRDATLLLEQDATASRILAAIERATSFHFAAHAVVNDFAPEMSALLVAGEGGDDDGRLYVHDLFDRRLELDLVVLSACSTARSREGRPRGNMTIARAFLNAGANVVVGTLWPVRDDAAAAFSTRFHQELAAGVPIAAAVRTAQLHVRSRYPSVSDWAGFCVIRGATPARRNDV